MSAPVEISLQTGSARFSALTWPSPGAPRVLCLHGWLDNAASFLPLAPYLGGLDLVALDFAGHGHSDHRPKGARYHMFDNVWDVDAVLDALEWDSCHLLGHSLGGVVACAYAVAAPERVRRLVSIDGLGPLSAPPERTAERVRRSLLSLRRASGILREFDDVDEAVQARRSVAEMSAGAARLLVERSLEKFADHYRWRTDPALNWHSPVLMTEPQVLDILGAISVPVLSIAAVPPAEWITQETVDRRLAAIPDCRSHRIEGHHHFHMEIPQAIAPLIREFLDAKEVRHARQPRRHSQP